MVTIWIDQAEGNATVRVSSDSPVAPVPTILATVQGIFTWRTSILVGVDVVGLTVEIESGILDAVGIAAWYSAIMRMQFVLGVVGSIIPSKDNITLYTVGVMDKQV